MSRAKWTVLGAIGALALVGVGLYAANAGPFGAGGAEQPIAFPHDLHAGTNQIPCLYCHSTADRSVDAGMPSVQTCAGCHIPGGVPLVRADRPEVQKLVAYWERKEPIPWVRVYDLPDHVHFPHMRHVNAGLDCQTCHGPVETMPAPQVRKVASLEMGWCVECHRTRGARTDCFVCHY
jgi:hypothetical protein